MHIRPACEQLRRYKPWDQLPASAFASLFPTVSVRDIPKHTVLFHQSESGVAVYIVVEGIVKGIKTDLQAKHSVLFLGLPGALLGEQTLVNAGWYAYRAQSLVDSVVIKIEAAALQQLALAFPAFGWEFSRYLINRLQDAQDRLTNIRFNKTQRRLGDLLKELARHHGHYLTDGDLELRLPLSHELISEMVSVSRQRVSAILAKWAEQGVIRYSRNRLILCKPALL
jgi:CRP/FNR family cyclic AMP-dependent transcriptional regulator